MGKNITTPQYLIRQRNELMHILFVYGFNQSDIGIIFNIDKSTVSRVLSNSSITSIESILGLGNKTKNIN